jgi:hypothetical protein
MADTASDNVREALLRVHDEAHECLEAAFFGVLEALTALEVTSACDRWRRLADAITDHHAAEDAALLPHLADDHTPPRGASARIQGPEHARLAALLGDGADLLCALSATPREGLRARMVRALEGLLRVGHLVSHHHARERELVYPFAVPRLTAEACERLRAGLAASSAHLRDDRPSG